MPWLRVIGLSGSIVLHVLLGALLISAAGPNWKEALGASDVEALEIEWLAAPAKPIALPAPTPPVARVEPPVATLPPPVHRPEPDPPPVPEVQIPEPVVAEAVPVEPMPPVLAESPPSPPVTEVVETTAQPVAPAPEAPLTARGKRAQQEYLRELMRWLARHRVYPDAAKKQKLEGVAQVRFAIDRDGNLLEARIKHGSGSPLLDQAALDVLQRANPMPAFPKALERRRLSVTLPIDFSLISD